MKKLCCLGFFLIPLVGLNLVNGVGELPTKANMTATFNIVRDTPMVKNNQTMQTTTPLEATQAPIQPPATDDSTPEVIPAPSQAVPSTTPVQDTNLPTPQNPQTLYDQNGNQAGTFHITN